MNNPRLCQLKDSADWVFLQDFNCHRSALAFSMCTPPLRHSLILLIGSTLKLYTASQSALALSRIGQVGTPPPTQVVAAALILLIGASTMQALTSRVGFGFV